MRSASRRQKQCSQKFNNVSKKKGAITHWNSTQNISQQSPHNIPVILFTKHRFYFYTTLAYINIGVVNEVPTQTGEDPITVDTTDTTSEYYTLVISLSDNSQSRQ